MCVYWNWGSKLTHCPAVGTDLALTTQVEKFHLVRTLSILEYSTVIPYKVGSANIAIDQIDLDTAQSEPSSHLTALSYVYSCTGIVKR